MHNKQQAQVKASIAYTLDNGLIVRADDPKHCAGYVFEFKGHGAFDPNGALQVNGRPVTPDEIATHNKLLGEMEVAGLVEHGKGLLYLSKQADGTYSVQTWAGTWKTQAFHTKTWRAAAFGGMIPAITVYFTGPDGKRWMGINKGHSQILRVRRLKPL